MGDHRPDGTPFWGEARHVMDDWSILAGTSDWWNGAALELNEDDDNALARVGTWAEGLGGSFDDYMIAHDGYSAVWMNYGDNHTYLELTDDESDVEVHWVIRARGAGSITAYDDYDTDWTYSLPANSLGTQAVSGSVSSGAWHEYTFAAGTAYTIEQLLADDGGVSRFGIEVTGDSVAIDVIQMRVYPVGGVAGYWASRPAEDTIDGANVTPVGFGNDIGESPSSEEFDFDDDGGAGQTAAWESMIAAIPSAGSDTEFPGTTHTGYGISGCVVESSVASSLDGSQHVGGFRYSAGYMVAKLVTPLGFVTPNPFVDGEEGVDFIRRPDRVNNDLKAYFEYPSPSTIPSVTGWENDSVNVVGWRIVVDATLEEAWPTGGGEHGVSINVLPFAEPPPFAGQPRSVTVPFGMDGTKVVLNDMSDGSTPATDVSVGVDLPLEPGFVMTFGNSFTFDAPPLHNIRRDISFAGASIVQTATFYLGTADDPLAAVVTIPTYRVWNPDGVPPKVSWVQHRQRRDGLGQSARGERGWEWSSTLRARGIR